MGCDGVDDQGPGSVPPPGGTEDHMDDGEKRVRRRVGVPLGSGGKGSHGYPPHMGIHQETASDYSGKGGLPPQLRALHGGGSDSGGESNGTMVGSERGK